MRRHSITRTGRRSVGSIAGLAAAAAVAWLLAQSTATQQPDTASPSAPAPGAAAMRVAVQPETGDLVPAPADLVVDDLGFPKPGGDLVIRTRADGGQYVDIRGHFLSYSVARLGSDGRIDRTCVSDPHAVRSLLETAPQAPTTVWEEE